MIKIFTIEINEESLPQYFERVQNTINEWAASQNAKIESIHYELNRGRFGPESFYGYVITVIWNYAWK